MTEDDSAEERAALEKFAVWLQEVEAAAAEIVEVGDLLFRGGQPSNPSLLKRYRPYQCVKAAVALPPGSERVVGRRQRLIESIDVTLRANVGCVQR